MSNPPIGKGKNTINRGVSVGFGANKKSGEEKKHTKQRVGKVK